MSFCRLNLSSLLIEQYVNLLANHVFVSCDVEGMEDTHLMYGIAEGNSLATRRIYAKDI